MLLFKLIKLTRQIRIWFGGYKEMERKHYLFTLPEPLPPFEIYHRLIPHGYQYNFLSTTFKKQSFTVRRLPELGYQIHLRFYKDGKVSGHFEFDPYLFPSEHLAGLHLRPLTKKETNSVRRTLLKGIKAI